MINYKNYKKSLLWMRIPIMMLLIGIVIISGCGPTSINKEGDNMVHKDVSFQTEDGIKISGDLYEGGKIGIILLHMYAVTKQTWNDFALELQKKGYSVLAIDFRGHGTSDLNYNDFTEKDFNSMVFDARAAKEFLDKEKTIVMGASIGANIALNFANEVDGVVALSPAFNYKGIETREDAAKINKPVLIIVSEEDKQSIGDSRELNNLIINSKLQVYAGKGHGTRMLDRETKELILSWLNENI